MWREENKHFGRGACCLGAHDFFLLSPSILPFCISLSPLPPSFPLSPLAPASLLSLFMHPPAFIQCQVWHQGWDCKLSRTALSSCFSMAKQGQVFGTLVSNKISKCFLGGLWTLFLQTLPPALSHRTERVHLLAEQGPWAACQASPWLASTCLSGLFSQPPLWHPAHFGLSPISSFIILGQLPTLTCQNPASPFRAKCRPPLLRKAFPDGPL